MLEAAQPAHDLGQVSPVMDFDHKFQCRIAIIVIAGADMDNVGILVGDSGGNGRQHTALIGDFYPDIRGKLRLDIIGPFHIDPLFRLVAEFVDVGASLVVYDDAATSGE